MAKLFIGEYEHLATDGKGNVIAAVQEPALTEQVVDFTAGEAKSANFDKRTRFVRVHTDTACNFKFGADPTAVNGANQPMVSGQTEVFGVPGSKIKVSVIA